MKKVVVMFVLVAIMLTGCNKQIVDTNYKFDRAIIYLPNGEIVDGKVESWTDYDDGEQLQVKVDGVTYLTNSYNCVLISE